jgi:hypothetical protein
VDKGTRFTLGGLLIAGSMLTHDLGQLEISTFVAVIAVIVLGQLLWEII